jgi:2-haloacid dehalogenase
LRRARVETTTSIYLHAASVLGVSPGHLALVAGYARDCHGAKRAGLTTGWICRTKRTYPPFFARPDVASDDLMRVADALLRLPAD